LTSAWGNASSLHRYGRIARDAIEAARVQVAALVGGQPSEVIWTSGGTESDNLALQGCTDGVRPTRVLYGATEHPAVLETAEAL
ncbi:aminotransferase class V-fold PLP-dependent enzyme, partial [Acinetobacter baumannii]